MKTVLSFSALLLFVGLLSGCVREEAELGSGTGRVLTVNYSFDGPLTRAAATAAECKVKDVALFFYNADDAHPDNETYVGCQAVTLPEGSGASHSFPLPLPDAVIPGNRYKLIIIGNYNEYRPEGKIPAVYAEQYKARTYSVMAQEIQGQLPSGRTGVTPPLPFLGKLLGQDGHETTLTGPAPTNTAPNVSIEFSRSVARFDLTNLAADRLKIAWAKVCNYRTRGYFFHEAANAGAMVRGTSATAPSLPLPPKYAAAPAPTGTAGALRQDLNTGGLYAFPNSPSYTSPGDSVTTCLLVAGYYQDPAAGTPNTTRLTYYRLNIRKNGGTQFLRRNHIYTLVINGVKQAGATSEEDAMNEKEQLTDYEVSNDNGNGNSGTVKDNSGNFLTLSRTSVTLGSEQGANALITVSVKKGASWALGWKNNAGNAFRSEKVNDTSFSILTTGKNETDSLRNATLTVSVEGLAAPLELNVNAMQLFHAVITGPQLLTVDGKQGAFDHTVSGQGTQVALPVVTGSPASKWKAEADTYLNGFVSSFTPTGANMGVLNLSFPTNLGAPRQGTLTVKRLLPDGNEDTSVAPVIVTFKQDGIVTLAPDYSASGLTIDAFLAEKGPYFDDTAKKIRFSVLLADPEHYKFVATCSFNKNSDAFITKGPKITTSIVAPLQTSKSAPSTIEGVHGEIIWLNVFRTGPGDKDIKGTLSLKAVPKDPASGGVEVTYSIPITITTSCKIGDSKIGTLLWADRNVGTTPRGEGGAAVGLNYTNDVNSDDHANTGFSGSYFTFDQAPAQCATFGTTNNYTGELATGWRLPTHDEQTVVAGRMRFSKQRGYIVSDDTTAGTVGCWFPFSGNRGWPNTREGNFWSSTSIDSGNACDLSVSTISAFATTNGIPSSGYSVRCVR